MANNLGIHCIEVQSGGKVILEGGTIIDSGTNNIGIMLNQGSTLLPNSCHIVYANIGIYVKENANLNFGSSVSTEFWNNTTSIYFKNFNGTCNFNKSYIKLRDSVNAIVVESSTGTINVSNCQIYNNTGNGIFSKAGSLNITGGNIYSNGNGINFGAGTLNITGGNIYNNTTGVYTNANYSGKMTITNANIHDNTQYAISHNQNADGSCNIFGGTINGKVYLGQRDNYINTNDKYPIFEVTPSQYFLKRKLVKTSSNACANTEIAKVALTKNADWYKYVSDDEYIVVWRGCNLKINHKDYFGNILSTEKITGNLGERYETSPKNIDGYDLISIPSNASGTYAEQDITIEYKYDLKNVAKVTFEDLLSGVTSAKYWYNASSNQFSGNGTEFLNGTVFEKYGNYKVVVVNNVGIEKELVFTLNKDSLVR